MTKLTDHTVVVVGAGGVGKSCITIRFLKNEFFHEYDPTIEENYQKKVTLKEGYEATLNVVDTAGQQEYSSLRDQHLRTGEGFLLVYAVNDEPSFAEVQELHAAVVMVREDEKSAFVICANKCDLPKADHKVPEEEGQKFADKIGAKFLSTSALENINIEEAFHAAVAAIRANNESQPKKTEQKKGRGFFGKKK
eukprot:Lithocolla_globosa_v1_NODE_1829_length_2311_cov_5.136525.p2 type:complete len:194 gc:universal NODE_1829_length_2311_cov_5.136525:1685-2266(+)